MFLKYLAVFFVSMVPLVELRGAIPIALGMGLDVIPSIAVCAVGNFLPMPLVYLFASKVLLWGLDKPAIGRFCRFCHDKGTRAGEKMMHSKSGEFGTVLALALFVGIPIPGTGAWTGTLGASFLNMKARDTAIAVALGLAIASGIMSTLSLVGVHVLGL